MLLFLFGFVSRTRFVFAALRTGVIAIGLVVVLMAYPDPGRLVIDAFLFSGAAVGTLVWLRLLERSGRLVGISGW